jgi:hypothetical protein
LDPFDSSSPLLAFEIADILLGLEIADMELWLKVEALLEVAVALLMFSRYPPMVFVATLGLP